MGREKGRSTSPSGPLAAGPVGSDYVPLQDTMVSTAHFGSKPLPPLDPLMMLWFFRGENIQWIFENIKI